MKTMTEQEYKCAVCGGIFLKGVSDEEALREREIYFPGHPDKDMELVCDDCWKKVHPESNPSIYEAYKTEHPEYYNGGTNENKS